MKCIRPNQTEIEFVTILENKEEATIFTHFKDKKYKILTLAKDSENLDIQVIYQSIYDDYEVWVRPYDEFFSVLDKKKYPNVKQKYRFEISN